MKIDNDTYVLDANVFIEASRRYYAFDLAPGFWENLIRYANTGQIKSIDRIKQELERGKDDLSQWAKDNFHEAFVSTSGAEVIDSYRDKTKSSIAKCLSCVQCSICGYL